MISCRGASTKRPRAILVEIVSVAIVIITIIIIVVFIIINLL